MPAEKRNGKKVESSLALSLYKKLKSKTRKQNITIAEVIRNAIQAYVK